MKPLDTVIWSVRSKTILGHGVASRVDPGVGKRRYQRAYEAVAESSIGIGFASFTFDPDLPGSVLVIPEETQRLDAWRPCGPIDMPEGIVARDGVAEWRDGFAAASASLDSGELEKLVLARRVSLTFGAPVSTMPVVARLKQSHPSSFIFGVDGLVGSSPELLASLRNRRLTSIPLAGTARTADELDDARIELEHRITADFVERVLGGVAAGLSRKRSVLKTGDLNHLATSFAGEAVPGITIADVLAALHPTPAVCGSPSDAALEAIRKLEPAHRGRYAGPIGWLDGDGAGEFALALRCGHIEGSNATLHAGGGLVKGADQEKELKETQMKLEPMLAALGIEI